MGHQNKPSLKINAISNWVALGVNIAVQLFMAPFVIKYLGKVGYGIWVLCWSFNGYYGLMDLGVGSAMTRYVARYAGRGDEKSLNETVSTAMTMFCFAGILVVALSYFVAAPLAGFFKVAPEQFIDFQRTFQIMGLAMGLSFPVNVFSGTVRAHEKFIVQNSVGIMMLLVETALTVFLLLHGYGLLGAAIAMLAVKFINIPVNLMVCRILIPSVRVSFALSKISVLRVLIAYGGITTIIVVADIMRINLNSAVIGKCVGLPAVGVYGIAASIIRNIVTFISTGMSVVSPRFAALDGKGDHEQVRRLLVRSISISSFLSFGAYMMAIIFGKQFIVWWINPEFVPAATVLWILSISYAFAIAQNPGIGLMYALNKHYIYAIATIIEAVFNVTLSIVLAYRYGIVGVALGTMIPMLIIKVLIMPIYMSKIVKLSIWQYVRPMIPPAVIAVIMILAAYNMGIITRGSTTFGNLLLSGMTAGVLYVTAYFLTMRKYDPDFIISLIPGGRKVQETLSTTD